MGKKWKRKGKKGLRLSWKKGERKGEVEEERKVGGTVERKGKKGERKVESNGRVKG